MTTDVMPRFVSLAGGSFTKGSGTLYAEEGPIEPADVHPFEISETEITNRQFRAFVEETGYKTIAERTPDSSLHSEIPTELLVPGSAVFDLSGIGRWAFVELAAWHSPFGPDSGGSHIDNLPVVHIAYEDALAYAAWLGGDLPTDAEWEFAARGSLDGATYEWGETHPDNLAPKRANTWQGIFPIQNSKTDGFAGIAPVGCFPANDFGLYDATGNAWEWVKEHDPANNLGFLKGGSFLCADNYCRRFRPAARYPQELDFSANHIGFRVVRRPKKPLEGDANKHQKFQP